MDRARRKRRSHRRHGPKRIRDNTPPFFDEVRYRKARPSGKQKAQKRRVCQADYALTLLPDGLFGLVRHIAELMINAFPANPPGKQKLPRVRMAEKFMRSRLTPEQLRQELSIRRGIAHAEMALEKALNRITFTIVPVAA